MAGLTHTATVELHPPADHNDLVRQRLSAIRQRQLTRDTRRSSLAEDFEFLLELAESISQRGNDDDQAGSSGHAVFARKAAQLRQRYVTNEITRTDFTDLLGLAERIAHAPNIAPRTPPPGHLMRQQVTISALKAIRNSCDQLLWSKTEDKLQRTVYRTEDRHIDATISCHGDGWLSHTKIHVRDMPEDEVVIRVANDRSLDGIIKQTSHHIKQEMRRLRAWRSRDMPTLMD